MNTVLVRIREADLKKLDNECKKLYLEAHPDAENISRPFMLSRVIRYYLEVEP